MFRKPTFYILGLFCLLAVLGLSGCTSFFEPVQKVGSAPTPLEVSIKGGVDDPNVFVDPEAFQAALLKALTSQDTAKLQMWMGEPFVTGAWRFGLSTTSPADAMHLLFTSQLGAENQLVLIKNVDLMTLMGGIDPISIPGDSSGVIDAFLVGGWGLDGRDEAILFVAREPNNRLTWHGWMVMQGGFSGARLGGRQAYQSDALGFRLYLPKFYEVSGADAGPVVVLAPGQGHPSEGRAGVIISVEPANGRTAERVAAQTAEQAKTEMGAGYTGGFVTVMNIDGEMAYSISGLPGQDINRQLFMVHNDLLYHMMFIPDNPRVAAYLPMEDVYAMIVNTFHFTEA